MARSSVFAFILLGLFWLPGMALGKTPPGPTATLKVSVERPDVFMFTIGELDLQKCKLRSAVGHTNKKNEGVVFNIAAGQKVGFQLFVDTHLTGSDWTGLFLNMDRTASERAGRKPENPPWPVFYAEPGAQYEMVIKPSLSATTLLLFRGEQGKRTPIPLTESVAWKTGAFRVKMTCPK